VSAIIRTVANVKSGSPCCACNLRREIIAEESIAHADFHTPAKIDPQNTLPSKPYTEELDISRDAVSDRVANKYLQLDPPEGKMSDWRKKELEVREIEKSKKRKRTRATTDGCGLIGRRKQRSLGEDVLAKVK
jgi:ribonuclease P protein subunit POP4